MSSSQMHVELKFLAVLGVLAAIAIVSLPIVFSFLVLNGTIPSSLTQIPTTPSVNTASSGHLGVSTSTGGLGELGSQCGGAARLPCKPGLSCSTEPDPLDHMGTCVTATSTKSVTNTTSNPTYQQVGESCNWPEEVCASGLYCKHGPLTTGSACASMDANAPHVSSLKVEGASFEQSIYRIPSSKVAQVSFQVVNGDTVVVKLIPSDGGTVTTPKQDKGGNYTAQLTLQKGYEGKLELTVYSKAKDSSVVSIDVASSD